MVLTSKGVNLEEYMQFVHVDPTNIDIQRALDDLVITHFLPSAISKLVSLKKEELKRAMRNLSSAV
ncbi:hypothetical protein VP01_4547g1 [Puccinia sorghi]|uniref:Uncharacterized protein n=1 Tax=Puccinia sorghi TaxID=27349 RepID=A0A0L6UNT9_9BASI|nr:hypothetical protein VP01_4547g1 [Puccinia sorghi]